ncbi:aldo/keto reductase [Microthyrium microscopicum]|uniref:Aldo/keto reductase n=1 Tax=Microthyrium microscopicum TaxID=703497 RepID=A0A6A6UD76_9PEZI|nr:aldo/keto reductase [Microthyrium microscopicum]
MADDELTLTSRISLGDSGTQMPILGFGVYEIDRPKTTQACLCALSAGYRLIDTAQIYQNEEEVGFALHQSNLPREDIFVTTKVRYPRLGKGKTYLRVLQSVQKIDPREEGYVDLFLIHSPHGLKPKERKELWLALEKLHEEGKAKAIGMKEYATYWPPAVNQILLHPWTQQRDLVEYCSTQGIVLQAFSPLTGGKKLRDPMLGNIAERIGKSPAQILIRYCLQKGWVPLVRSEKEERIKQNLEAFDFCIAKDHMATLDSLDRLGMPSQFL